MRDEKIPKIIHYCWFGGKPLTALARRCLASWKAYLPDYEIRQWSEENFDVGACSFTKGAYDMGKWAFVSDYVRLQALYDYGGIYMDTDMEIVMGLDGFLKYSAFAGMENDEWIAAGIMGARKNNPWIGMLLDYYRNQSFTGEDGTNWALPIPKVLSSLSRSLGFIPANRYQVLAGDVHIFPRDYFYPLSYISSERHFTENTHGIHYYSGSWLPFHARVKHKLKKLASGWRK